ncbi:hypothetical protein EV193_103412 [Herbihabitans rhizosphaerae]|uniref:Uncharacterized protein n=1 Tax=Herbihabitans rhizosphaerae TaxID=1872711 RepID=A0A4Q7KWF5_9PSEU|nr:hypothetical protein [Herbihabitans rhizosphaerae]RZS41094.1 hypothetical protein EV193_103412 [Herbihabitans rhizosphaerae]
MRLDQIAGQDCGKKDCPAVFVTDRDTIAVQGNTLDRATPANEAVVEIPTAVLKEAVRALGW